MKLSQWARKNDLNYQTSNREVTVMNETEEEMDLVQDFIDVLNPLDMEKTKWNIYCCNPLLDDCGRIVYGNSEEYVIERWNNNETDEFIE